MTIFNCNQFLFWNKRGVNRETHTNIYSTDSAVFRIIPHVAIVCYLTPTQASEMKELLVVTMLVSTIRQNTYH